MKTVNCAQISVFAYQFLNVVANPYSTFLGPVFHRPSSLSLPQNASAILQGLVKSLNDSLTASNGSLSQDLTSAAIMISSIHQQRPIMEYYHAATNLVNNSIVDENTVFRIGSVSKVFTVYSLLLHGGFKHFDDLVIDHVPELRRYVAHNDLAPGVVVWKDITLGALAGQLSDNIGDLAGLDYDWAEAGLPSLNATEVPNCAGNASKDPCSREEFFSGFINLPPIFSSFTSPAYSNAAFRILAYAISDLANQDYNECLDEITRNLGMNATSFSMPDAIVGAVVHGDESWQQDMGDEGPTGGMYSSVKDLTKFASAILSAKQIGQSIKRRWLKPTSHTASINLSIGMPWEIHRFETNTVGHRVIDLYSKSGSIGVYTSELILIPDHDISVAVLTAGPDGSVINQLTNAIINTIVPLVESGARLAVSRALTGTYSDASNSSILTVSLDAGPGLVITDWINEGRSLIEASSRYSESTSGGELISIRLFPTLISVPGKEIYRVVFETEGQSQDTEVFGSNDGAWASVDSLVYGRGALDRFVFDISGPANEVTLFNDGTRAILTKSRD